MRIAEVELETTVADIQHAFGLEKVRNAREDLLRTRAAVYQLLREIDDDEFVDQAISRLRRRDAKYWRAVTNDKTVTLGQVLKED